MSDSKWTHERILEELRRHSWASQAMSAMRDDMQATIDELEAKVTRLTAALMAADEALLAMDETGDDNE